MGLRFGTADPTGLRYGSSTVQRAYLGGTEVWGGSAPAVTVTNDYHPFTDLGAWVPSRATESVGGDEYVATRNAQTGAMYVYSTEPDVTPGDTVRVSCEARTTSGLAFTMQVRIYFKDAGGAFLPHSQSDPAPVTATRTVFEHSATVPATAARTFVYFLTNSTNVAHDGLLDLRLSKALHAVNYTGPHFDGDTPDGGGYTYAWVGTAGASPSQKIPA